MGKPTADVVHVGAFVLDRDRAELRNGNGSVVPLRPKVFAVLEYLSARPGRVVDRGALLDAVWPGLSVGDESLSQAVSVLRLALAPHGHSLVRTIPKRGYMLDVPVLQQEPETNAEADCAGDSTQPAHALRLTLASASRPFLIVLPFASVGKDPELAAVAEGITEELTTALSRGQSVPVVGRSSAATYRVCSAELSHDAYRLEAGYALEGAVRKLGTMLRVDCRLIETATGLLIWAECFDHRTGRTFSLYDRLAHAVNGALRRRLEVAEFVRLSGKRGIDPEACRSYLRAVSSIQGTLSVTRLDEAERLLRQAMVSQPHWMEAKSLLVRCHLVRHAEGWATADQKAEALQLAREVLASERGCATPLVFAGQALASIAGEHEAAFEVFYQALALDPDSYGALLGLGTVCTYTGEWRRALEHLTRAGRLRPAFPAEERRLWGVAFAAFIAGHYPGAAEFARQSLLLRPEFTSAWRVLAASLAHMKRIEKARSAGAELLKRAPQFTLEKYRAERTLRDADVATRIDRGLSLAGIPAG